MAQADARQNFIRAYPGVTRMGRPGYWYRCAHCGGWCARPGKQGVRIPENQKMEVDHIRPWSKGGSDEVWNLQPLCKPCNRGKSANETTMDQLKMLKNDIVHGDFIGATVKKAVRQNKFLKALGIGRRK